MKTLLIFGGSGLLATNWALFAGEKWNVHLVCHERIISFDGAVHHQIGDDSAENLAAIIHDVQPDLVINAAGLASVQGCEDDRENAIRANAELPARIAQGCRNEGVKFVHISTDHLFGGDVPYRSEDDAVDPLNQYAVSKYEGEQAISSIDETALVIRTNFFGWGPSYRQSISDMIISSLRKSESITMFDDVFFTPIYIARLVQAIHQLVALGGTGIYNVAGSDRVSKYEFAVAVAKVFELDPSLIVAANAEPHTQKIRRPVDLSLSTKKIEQTGVNFESSLSEDILALKADEERCRDIRMLGKSIPYGRHFVDEVDIAAVEKTLRSGQLTQGPAIAEFENKLAEFVGAKYAVAVSSATAGLHIAYLATGLQKDDAVLTPALSFVSTANAAEFCGASVTFVDIDPKTLNVSQAQTRSALEANAKIKIVAPVLFAGASEGAKEVFAIAKAQDKMVVEDASHALGGSYQCGAKVGSCKYSDATVFSLHPVKSIAAGEGGVVTTSDPDIYRRLLRLRSHGINKLDDCILNPELGFTDGQPNIWYYEMRDLGFNYRITDIQCSLANSQLDKLTDFLERRRFLVGLYRQRLASVPNIKPASTVRVDLSANHLFPVWIDFEKIGMSRNDFMRALMKKGIFSQVHYLPVFLQPFYKKYHCKVEDFPNVMNYYRGALSLPVFFALTDDEYEYVVAEVIKLCGGDSKKRTAFIDERH